MTVVCSQDAKWSLIGQLIGNIGRPFKERTYQNR